MSDVSHRISHKRLSWKSDRHTVSLEHTQKLAPSPHPCPGDSTAPSKCTRSGHAGMMKVLIFEAALIFCAPAVCDGLAPVHGRGWRHTWLLKHTLARSSPPLGHHGDVREANAHAGMVERATKEWVEGLILELNLCPWAARSTYSDIRVLCDNNTSGTSEAGGIQNTVLHRARELTAPPQRWTRVEESMAMQAPFETTLFVVPSYNGEERYEEFRKLWTAVHHTLSCTDGKDVAGVCVLAFHACRSVPSDRSPFPVLQLLRKSDLIHAREGYARSRGMALRSAMYKLLQRNRRAIQAFGEVRFDQKIKDLASKCK